MKGNLNLPSKAYGEINTKFSYTYEMDKDDLKKAMQEAQEMQLGILRIQEELLSVDISGFSDNKMVQIIMNGQGDTKSVNIKSELMKGSKEELESSVLEAIQDATQNAANLTQEKMSKISKKIGG